MSSPSGEDAAWLFPICCTTDIPIEIIHRILVHHEAQERPTFVFVDSVDQAYNGPSESGALRSPPDYPFIGMTDVQCWEMLCGIRGTSASHFSTSAFVIMDERSKHDDTVLLVQVPSGSRGTRSIRTDFATAQETLIRWKFEYGSVSEDEEYLEDVGYDDVLRDFYQEGVRRERATPARGSGVPINTAQAHPQTDCALFRLPAELRLQIYGLVIGSGVIHIRTQECKRHSRPRPHFGFYKAYSYAVCRLPDTWVSEYEKSREQDESSGPNRPKEIYRFAHDRCVDHLSDFTAQRYTGLPLPCRFGFDDPHMRRFGHPNNCGLCEEHHMKLAEEFGSPPEGLKRRHASSELDLNLLFACRQIYHEAAIIPFQNFVFDFFDFGPFEVEHWATKILYTHQARAIKTVHFECYVHPPHLRNLQFLHCVSSSLKGVTQLRLSIVNTGSRSHPISAFDLNAPLSQGSGEDGGDSEEESIDWGQVNSQTKVKICQVIINKGGTRGERRMLAAHIERLFTETDIDAFDQRS
ncbi:uncharacterized protein RHO25_009075 [Cercospora beticola]|uniref:Uncharacterized protein n=1 Tax=Cercospora beticola TaxID=122368 RepID=A0ABZ0NYF4_CERBT|nr:hypothetical protein RHO25_009075 [Cercospora beticola]CAK1356740.1 unnamed protein product [Cercospora beticola]